jgi:hypothetical protein
MAKRTNSTLRHEESQPKPPRQETVEPDLKVEELEERIAPRLASNHNETMLLDD